MRCANGKATLMGNKLYVGNLSYDTTEESLRNHFSSDDRKVTEVNLIMDREPDRPRGFGFVTMDSDEAAKAAIEALNGKELDGRELKVNEAKAKTNRDGGGGNRW